LINNLLLKQAFFISLSANENVLPTLAETKPLLSGLFNCNPRDFVEILLIFFVILHLTDDNDVVSHYFSRRGKRYGLLSFFNYAKDSLLPQRVKKSF